MNVKTDTIAIRVTTNSDGHGNYSVVERLIDNATKYVLSSRLVADNLSKAEAANVKAERVAQWKEDLGIA